MGPSTKNNPERSFARGLWGPLVLPTDAPVHTVAGPDPDRVLLIGGGPAAGVGMRSHSTALTGALARRLSADTGRGAVVEAIGQLILRLAEVPALLDETRSSRFDAIVVTSGMLEAFSLVSTSRWKRELLSVLDTVHARTAKESAVVFLGMPAPSSVTGGSGRRSRRIDRRASALNTVSQVVATTRQHGHFVQLAPTVHVHGQPTAEGYEQWAQQISAVLSAVLMDDRSRPSTGRIAGAAEPDQDRATGAPRSQEHPAAPAGAGSGSGDADPVRPERPPLLDVG